MTHSTEKRRRPYAKSELAASSTLKEFQGLNYQLTGEKEDRKDELPDSVETLLLSVRVCTKVCVVVGNYSRRTIVNLNFNDLVMIICNLLKF